MSFMSRLPSAVLGQTALIPGLQGAACTSLRRALHSLPRSRSVEQAPVQAEGFARSMDAPLDPFEMDHRDTHGMSPEEVDAAVHKGVAQGGARSTEALSGRAEKLHNDPQRHMNETTHQGHQFGDWTNAVVGDGVKETVKTGAQKAKDALKKMFDPARGGGASTVIGKTDRQEAAEDTSTPPGSVRHTGGI